MNLLAFALNEEMPKCKPWCPRSATMELEILYFLVHVCDSVREQQQHRVFSSLDGVYEYVCVRGDVELIRGTCKGRTLRHAKPIGEPQQ